MIFGHHAARAPAEGRRVGKIFFLLRSIRSVFLLATAVQRPRWEQYKRVRFINRLTWTQKSTRHEKQPGAAIPRHCQERRGCLLVYQSVGTAQELNIFFRPTSVRSVFLFATAVRKTKRGIVWSLAILAGLIIIFPSKHRRMRRGASHSLLFRITS